MNHLKIDIDMNRCGKRAQIGKNHNVSEKESILNILFLHVTFIPSCTRDLQS